MYWALTECVWDELEEPTAQMKECFLSRWRCSISSLKIVIFREANLEESTRMSENSKVHGEQKCKLILLQRFWNPCTIFSQYVIYNFLKNPHMYGCHIFAPKLNSYVLFQHISFKKYPKYPSIFQMLFEEVSYIHYIKICLRNK